MKKNLKKIVSLFLVFLMLFTTFAFAEATPPPPPIDVNGGNAAADGVAASDKNSQWSNGEEGLRVAIVEIASGGVKKVIDFSNNIRGNVTHFGKFTKTQLRTFPVCPFNAQTSAYKWVELPGMPQIIDGDMNAIKEFFCRKGTIKTLAEEMDFDYDKLVSGKYKITLEPMAYFTYKTVRFGMTATEAAFFDRDKAKLQMHAVLGNLIHQKLPLAGLTT